MNFLSKKVILFLTLIIVAFSCQKNNFDLTEVKPGDLETEVNYINDLTDRMSAGAAGDDIKLGCLLVKTPFEIVDKEEQTHVINDEADLRALRQAAVEIVDFVYPLSVIFEGGEEKDINNAAELGFAFASCLPDDGWEEERFPAYVINFEHSCFAIKYPISVTKLDNTVVELENEASFSALLAAEEKVFFNFPLTLYNKEGEAYTLSSAEELFDLLLECREDGDEEEWDYGFDKVGCYKLVFPFNIILIDRSTLEIENKEMFSRILLADKMKAFAFPLNLIDKDGSEFTVSSKEELKSAIEDCKEEEEGEGKAWELISLYKGAVGDERCYMINFPIEVLLYDENQNERATVLENIQDYKRILETAVENAAYATFRYPIEVTWKNEDRTLVSITDAEMLKAIIERCEYGREDDDEELEKIWQLIALYRGVVADEACYQINFPIEVLLYDENSNERAVVIEDMGAYKRILETAVENAAYASFRYPIEITWTDGTVVNIENVEGLKKIIERCEGLQDDDDDGDDDEENNNQAYEVKLLLRGAIGEDPCYEINFPITVNMIKERREERMVELDRMEAVRRLLDNLMDDIYYKLEYPIEVILTESQETITIENIDTLKRILEGC